MTVAINKKILQIVDFAGFKYFLMPFENLCFRILRRVRDSNPRTCYSQQFSRLPQSTTLPTLPELRLYRCFQSCKYRKIYINFTNKNISGSMCQVIRGYCSLLMRLLSFLVIFAGLFCTKTRRLPDHFLSRILVLPADFICFRTAAYINEKLFFFSFK